MNIKDKQNKLVEAMKKDPDLKKHYKDIEDLNETQMKQLIKVCTLLNADQIKLLKAEIQFNEDCANQYKKSARILQSKVKTYEADIEEVNKEKHKASLRSANDLKGTTKLF